MFSFPTSMAMMTEESRVELEGPVAFVAAPVRASRGRSGTFVPVRQSDLADPRSFACVFSPVSARRTFEPRTIDWRSWETIAASPRCRDEASRAARDARTRLWNARLFRDEPFTYHVRKPEKIFPTVKSRVRGFCRLIIKERGDYQKITALVARARKRARNRLTSRVALHQKDVSPPRASVSRATTSNGDSSCTRRASPRSVPPPRVSKDAVFSPFFPFVFLAAREEEGEKTRRSRVC